MEKESDKSKLRAHQLQFLWIWFKNTTLPELFSYKHTMEAKNLSKSLNKINKQA